MKSNNKVCRHHGEGTADSSRPSMRTAKEYQATRKVNVRGATAPDGTPWVEIVASSGDPAVWVRFEELADDAALAKRRMQTAGLILFKKDLSDALDKARSVDAFPPAPLIERPGWSGPYFALLSGEIVSPDCVEEAILLFEPQPKKCAKAGDETWRKGVKRLARGQPVVTFAAMIPFAAPILRLSRIRENFGFELSGAKGVGKSTLQRLAASAAGPARDPSGINYWISANSTLNALEEQMPLHADMPMIIEEMSMMDAGETEKVRASRSKELVFRLTSGLGKDRFKTVRQTPARFVYLTSTNDPIATLIGASVSDAAAAAADRLLAIPIGRERKHGIFEEELPKGFDSGEAAARAIDALVADHYGYPIRVFLRGLVEARAQDEATLKRDIETYVMEFREKVAVDASHGSEVRVADTFGVIYAAGQLARRHGALPKSLDCLEAAIYCYRINRDSMGTELSNVDRLRAMTRKEGVVQVDRNDTTKRYRKAVAAAPALILKGKKGKRELLVTTENLEKTFKSPRVLFSDPAVRRLMRFHQQRNSIQVKVVHDQPKKRFYCFKLLDEGE